MKDIKYLKPNLRIHYAYHLADLGYSYRLQKKVKFLWWTRWKMVAWSYNLMAYNEERLISYLFWYWIHHDSKQKSVLTHYPKSIKT